MGRQLTPEAIAARSAPVVARRPAPTVECASSAPAGLDAAGARAALVSADAGSRQRLAASLQRQVGNAAVQRLLAPGSSAQPAIQRWGVGLRQGEDNCLTVANYVNQHTPYKNTPGGPGWARTKADFAWSGSAVYATSGATTTATVSGAAVTHTANVDMPVWAPTDPVMKKAWGTAMTALRAHEAVHEGVADEWDGTLKTNLAGLTVTVANKTDAAFRAAVKPSWDGWIGQHAAAQAAKDPYSVTVDCAAAESEAGGDATTGESASADDATTTAPTGEGAAAASAAPAGESGSAGAVASNDDPTGESAAPSPAAPASGDPDDETLEAA